jgi:putative lipase involved disintegration of autophagic bodies
MYSLLPVAIQTLLTSFLWTDNQHLNATKPLRFQLRHEHAVSNASRIIFSDVAPSFVPDVYGVDTRHVISHQPSSMSAFSRARLRSLRHAQNDASLWKENDLLAPNVKHRETLLTLAKMTSNAYNKPADKEWYDLDTNWNSVSSIKITSYSAF